MGERNINNNSNNFEASEKDLLQAKIDEQITKLENLTKKWELDKVDEITSMIELRKRIEQNDLKAETWDYLQKLKDNFSNFDEITQTILEIQKLEIAKEAISQKEKLREEIEEEKFKAWLITKSDLNIWKYLSQETIDQINNPQNIIQNMKWIFIWTLETLVIALILSKDILKWFATLANDITLIAKNKWKYDWFKEV